MHARPASMLVQKASQFDAEIYIQKENDKINAKSIMGVLALGATYKTKLQIITEGEEEQQALEAIVELFENRFEEE